MTRRMTWTTTALAIAILPYAFATGCPNDSIGPSGEETPPASPDNSGGNQQPVGPGSNTTAQPPPAMPSGPGPNNNNNSNNTAPHDGGAMTAHDAGGGGMMHHADAAPADSGEAMNTEPDAGEETSDTGETAADAGEMSTPDAGAMMSMDDAGTTSPAPDAAAGGGTLPFGATCTVDGDCQAGLICRQFGQLGLVCTKACVVNTDCPVGSQGQKCNQQGLCRP